MSGLGGLPFITQMANGKTYRVGFPCTSVVIDAEGMQNIEQGGEEGEELEEDRER